MNPADPDGVVAITFTFAAVALGYVLTVWLINKLVPQ